MILILSEHNDVSTDKVCYWLNYYKSPYLRINSYTNSFNIINKVYISNNFFKFEIKINGKIYDLNDFSIIWCRRGYTQILLPSLDSILFDESIRQEVKKHLKNEINTLEKLFEYLIDQKTHINNKNHYNTNKLITLMIADKHGFKIPETLITTNAKDLYKYYKKEEHLISKNIQDVFNYIDNDYFIGQTILDTKIEDIETDSFYYSLFQKKINIKYELRIFFLLDKFFCHAIIPFKNRKRYTPYELNSEIRLKLSGLMNELKLESGSIDIIVDKNNEFYFLEVNPVGQFDYLSGYNNYYIEKEIAKALIDGKKSKTYKN